MAAAAAWRFTLTAARALRKIGSALNLHHERVRLDRSLAVLRARARGGAKIRETRRLPTNRPCLGFSMKSPIPKERLRVSNWIVRDSIMMQSKTRQTLTSDGLSTCRSKPAFARSGQEFEHNPARPSPNSRGLAFQRQYRRSARAIHLRNEYAIDLTCHCRENGNNCVEPGAMQALFDGARLRLPVYQTRLGGKLQVRPCPQCPVSDGRPEKGGLS